MRIVYLGTSEFAVEVLERLARGSHRPLLVVTRPARPRGRGRKLSQPPVAETAARLGIEAYQPESINSVEARERIAAVAPELVCICAYGALIKEPLLSAHELLNVHPSLLPRWRGAAPIERAIEAGDDETGVSIMRPTAELDAGPVCLQGRAPIGPEDDYGSLATRLAELGGELLVETLGSRPECLPQAAGGVSYAAKIEPEDRRLDPTLPAAALERRVRALCPHIGSYVELPGGERLRVRRARVSSPACGDTDRVAGAGLRTVAGMLLLATAAGALELLEVQPAGGRPMPAADYLRGHPSALAG